MAEREQEDKLLIQQYQRQRKNIKKKRSGSKQLSEI